MSREENVNGGGRATGERERQTLRALHEATRELMSATDERRIAALATDAASEVLGFAGTGVRFHDAEDGVLRSTAVAGTASTEGIERPPFTVGGTPHGEAFRTGETVVHDVGDESPYGLDPFERTMYVPLGDHGVLSLGRRTGRFSRTEVTTAEILGRNVTAALDRAERERRLRERERRLERERRRLDEFAGVVSHDLRNPLGVAIGRVDIARREASDGVDEQLSAVERAHERMEARIEEVLTLAREGRVVGDPRPVDLDEVARAAWTAVDECEDGATLVDVDSLGTVEGDRERLRALFENLFSNAVEHSSTSPGSQARQDAVEHSSTGNRNASRSDDAVEHSSTSPGSKARQDAVEHDHTADTDGPTVTVGPLDDGFYVEDDGPGIPPDRRETVLHSGFTTNEDGTGFGLAIVRSIVEAHGWTITVTQSDTGGARFEIEYGDNE